MIYLISPSTTGWLQRPVVKPSSNYLFIHRSILVAINLSIRLPVPSRSRGNEWLWSPAVGVLVGVSNGVMSDAASLDPLLDVANGVAVADAGRQTRPWSMPVVAPWLRRRWSWQQCRYLHSSQQQVLSD